MPRLAAYEGPASIQDLIVKLLDDLQDRADNPADIFGLPTGFYDLDRLLGGLMPGGLYILASRPAMGITTLAFNIAQNISLEEGLPSLYVSSTAPAAEMSNRLIASVGRISRSHLVSGKLTDEEWPRLTEAVERVRDIPIYFDNDTGLTLATVLEHSRTLAARLGKLGLVVVDGVESLVDIPNHEGLQGAIRQLSLLARELDCPVIALLCALGQVEGRLDKRPLIQDLPATEAIERHAHAVFCLYRDEYYHRETSREPGVAELIVLRNRGGPVGTVKLAFFRNISRFESLA